MAIKNNFLTFSDDLIGIQTLHLKPRVTACGSHWCKQMKVHVLSMSSRICLMLPCLPDVSRQTTDHLMPKRSARSSSCWGGKGER